MAAKRWTLVRRGLVLVRRRAAARPRLAGDDPAVLRGDVRRRRAALRGPDAVGGRHRHRRRARRRRHRLVGARADHRRPRHELVDVAGSGVAAWRCCCDVAVNGTHPLLPWLAFFCAGIVLGRLLGRRAWRPAAIAIGWALFTIATLVGSAAGDGPRAELLSTDPFDRALPYTASALGTALLAFATITWLAERFPSASAHPAARRRRGDEPHAVRRPRLRVPARRRPPRLDPPDRARHRAALRRRLLGRRDRRRRVRGTAGSGSVPSSGCTAASAAEQRVRVRLSRR